MGVLVIRALLVRGVFIGAPDVDSHMPDSRDISTMDLGFYAGMYSNVFV